MSYGESSQRLFAENGSQSQSMSQQSEYYLRIADPYTEPVNGEAAIREASKQQFTIVDTNINDIDIESFFLGECIPCESAEHIVFRCTVLDTSGLGHEFVFKLKNRDNVVYFMSKRHALQMANNFRRTDVAIAEFERECGPLRVEVNKFLLLSARVDGKVVYAWAERYLPEYQKFLAPYGIRYIRFSTYVFQRTKSCAAGCV